MHYIHDWFRLKDLLGKNENCILIFTIFLEFLKSPISFRYVIGMHIDKPCHKRHGWLWQLATLTNHPYKCNDNGTGISVVQGTGPSNYIVYVSALYYTLSSLTTCGFGNISPNTASEKLFGCCSMLIGCEYR